MSQVKPYLNYARTMSKSHADSLESQRGRTCRHFRRGRVTIGPCRYKKSVGYVPLPDVDYDLPFYPPVKQPHFDDFQYPGGGGGGGYGHYPYSRPRYPSKQPGRQQKTGRVPADDQTVYHKLTVCQTTDGYQGLCRPPAYCFSQYDNTEQYLANRCTQSNGVVGICCPDVIREPKLPQLPITIPRIKRFTAQVPKMTKYIINEAAEVSRTVIAKQLTLERELIRRGFFQRKNSREALHQSFFGGPDPVNRKLAHDGLVALETTIQLAKRFKLTPIQARDGLPRFTLFETTAADHCIPEPRCYESKYRTADGHCNNLNYPLWGRSLTSFIRLVPPAYHDGLNEPRRSIDGSALPGARLVSSRMATDIDIPDRKFSLLVMQWGQFIDHDLTLTASTRVDSERGEGLSCCFEELARNPQIMHPACFPIPIPNSDAFYSRHNQHCINFVRNAPSPRHKCTLGPREQTNQLTQYMDGSMVYGSTEDRARSLRAFFGGKLRYNVINEVEYLPFDTANQSDECAIPASRRLKCFVGGDVRVNEQTGLTILHMLWLREHNRVASTLEKLNPQWNDEILYQEARRIVAAVIQHITLNEWTPLILGRRVMKDFGLFPQPKGYLNAYDPKLNGGILNAFATAAYRFHSLIQGMFKLMTNQGRITEILALRNLFNNPESVYRRGAFDEYLNALSGQPTQHFDQHFSQELTNHLFQEHNDSFGMDLISLNLQRGREHGLPGYNTYRKICGLQPIQSFQQLAQVMRRGSAELFASLYKHVDDIDLFIAGNHELPLPGAAVGPTFACILAEQSRRNKYGDRFWYENGGMPHSFTEAQLEEIRKHSMAAVICENSDRIDKMQPLALVLPSEWNPKTPCSQIAKMDLSLWKNERLFRK